MKASVWLGSEKQVSYGILANATLSLHVDGVHIVDLREWKVRQTKNGLAALPPSRNAGPDKNNPGKDRYINYYSIFPGDIDTYKKAQQTILDEYYSKKEGGGQSQPSDFPSAGGNAYKTPTSQPQASQGGGVPPVPPAVKPQGQGATTPAAPPKPNDAAEWPYGDM